MQFYELVEVDVDGRTISLKDGDVEDLTSDFTSGIRARVLSDGAWGFASGKSVEETEKEDVLRRAERASRHNKASAFKDMVESKALKGTFDIEPDKHPRDFSIGEIVDMLEDFTDVATTGRVTSVDVSFIHSDISMKYENSEGSRCEFSMVKTGVSGKSVAKEGNNLQTARERSFGTGGIEVLEGFCDKCREMGKRADALLDANSPKSGRMKAVLDPELAGVFVHEALGHSVEGDHIVNGNSILQGMLGEKIASEELTVKDDPTLPGLFGSYPFDWGGIPSQETVILDGGRLNTFLGSRETSASTGTSPTPNLRSSSYSDIPLIRMSNTYIDSGNSSFEEVMEEVNEGILLCGSRGGQVSPAEGFFQFNAEEGYSIDNGEKKERIRDVSMSGRTLKTLRDIVALSDKVSFNSGRCGKNGQTVSVSEGAPYVAVSEILVGGRE